MRLSFRRRAAPRRARAVQRLAVAALAVVVLVAVAAIAWTGVQRDAARRNRIEQWQLLLDQVANDRGAAIEGWLEGSFRVAALIASADTGSTGRPPDRLEATLEDAVAGLGCRRALVVDRQGTVVAADRRSLGSAGPSSEAVRQAVEQRQPAADLITDAAGTPLLVVATPSGSALDPRAVVLELDPASWLYPELGRAVGTTGETVVVRIEGDEVRFLSPLRFDSSQPLRLTLPADQPDLAAAAAAAGLLATGEFRDYRGVPVLVAGRPIAGTPWKLLVKVDRDEIVTDLENRFAATGALLVGVVAVGVALGGLAWRAERRRGQQQVLVERARLGSVLAEAGDAILFADGEGRILQANRSAGDLYGYSEGAIVGRTLADLGMPAPLVEGPAPAAAARGRAYEGLHLRSDGERVPVEVSWRSFEVDGACYQVLIARDISERRAAQARIELLNRLLRTTSEVNQLLVRERDVPKLLREACRIAVEHGGFAAAWVAQLGPGGELEPIAWWGVAEDFFEEARLRLGDDDSRRSPAVRAGADGTLVVLEDLRDEPEDLPWRSRAVRRGIVALAALPLEALGERWGVLWVGSRQPGFFTAEILALLREMASDLAFALEVAQTEARRRAAEREVERTRRLEALGRLAGGVAHDFNNLLQAILSNLELARSAARGGTAEVRHLEEAAAVAGRAARLTRQLLAFGRRQPLASRPVVLDEVVGGLRVMLTRLLSERIDLRVDLGADGAAVLADPGQLEQIALNLVLNARDAMAGGGGLLTVRTRCAEASGAGPGWVELEVADSGHGLSPEARERLFEPFFTTKDPGRGTGLGLATVHGIVHQSGGEIRVIDRDGGGTTFVVRLPEVAPVEIDLSSPRPPLWSAPAAPVAATILLAEDDAAVRSTLVDLLVGEGYRVLAAGSGAEAIDLITNHPGAVDLLLTDVIMPGLEAWEIVDGVRRLAPDVGVILMSGYLGEQLAHCGPEMAALPALQKPFSRDELLRAIEDALR